MRVRAYLIVAALGVARVVAAQQIEGVVRDSLSRLPIAGAVVMALDAAGRSLGRDLTNADGRYALDVPTGASRLRVVRIGFRPQDATIPIASAAPIVHDFVLEPLPSLLEPVLVNEGEQCPGRDDRARALGLWEQARAGLLASVAARQARPGEMRMWIYQRAYIGSRGTLVWQQVQDRSARTSRPFVPVRTAAEFATRGYLSGGGDGEQLAAPDADVLLDDSFAATHCFSIAAPDSAHAGELGLAFDPSPGRDRLVDVRGVLWIEPAPPAVRTLDFRYTGLSPAAVAAGSGGTISFRTEPNGVVFIDDWTIVSARAARGERTNGGMRFVGENTLRIRIAGGRVRSARWDDSTYWEAPAGSIIGRVVGYSGLDLAGVSVWLSGTGDTTTTDSTGAFSFDGLLPGPYQLNAASQPLAAAGVAQNLSPDSATVHVAGPARAVVHLDSAVAAARGVCGHPEGPMAGTLLFIRVTDADGWVVPKDSVTAMWREPSSKVLGISIPHEGRFAGATDDNGRVVVCDPKRGEPIAVTVGNPLAPQFTTKITLPIQNAIDVTTLQLGRSGSR